MKRILWMAVIVLACATSSHAQQFLARMNMVDDPDLLKRVEFAMVKTAIAVQNEDVTTCCYPEGVTEATATDEQRASARRLAKMRSTFATMALRSPREVARHVIKGVITNMSLTLSSTDTQLEATVVSMWSAFSKTDLP